MLPLGEWVSLSLSCPSFFSYSARNLAKSCMKELVENLKDPSLFRLSRLLQLLMLWDLISERRFRMLGRFQWRTPWSNMTANSTLVTHGSFRSLPFLLSLNLPMCAVGFDVPWLIIVMACERLSSDRKLGQRLRDDRNFSFHYSFSLIHFWG